MTNGIPLVVITGFPGAGKSTAAELLASWRRVSWVRRYNTRPLRPREVDGTDNIRISDKEYLRLLEARKIFHPTETVNLDGSKYYRGFPLIEEWSLSIEEIESMGLEILLLVCGPRAALEIQALVPAAKVIFLSASNGVILERILRRAGGDFVGGHGDRVREYRRLHIESEFDQVIDTDCLLPYDVAKRIELIAGFNPVMLGMRRI